jgi:hypothetical protein
MPLEQQVQVRIGKTAGAPMLLGDDVAGLRLKLRAQLAAPRAELERLA